MADFDSQLPVRAIPTQFATEVADSGGTIINPVEEFAQGSTTTGQKGPLEQAAVTTVAPIYVDGTTAPLSLDANGNLRVAATTSGTQDVNIIEVGGNPVTTTVPVSGTVTVIQPTGTNLHTVVDNFPASVEISNDVGNPIPVIDVLVQGSTTSGQFGNLSMGAVTTLAPTYVTGTTNPLSLTPTGQLRVEATINDSSNLETVTYNTVAAVAAGASSTQTYTPGTDVYFDGVDASASGQMKVEIQIAAATKAVLFTSKGNLQLMWRLQNPIFVASGTAITIIRTNTDNQAMDVYSNVQTHI